MPATSIRDLVIHGDDLVVGTHGRSFWILDDVTPLRQLTADVARADAFLFQPGTACRVRRSKYTDTPLPPEEPAGQNPPDGAILDYVLGPGSRGIVALEILDGQGGLVRRFTSEDKSDALPEVEMNVPTYWVRPFRALPAGPGLHRFVWDLRTAPPPAVNRDYPISAVPHDTPLEPLGVAVLPATYTVRLSVGAKTLTQPLVVTMDPRVTTPADGLARQHDLSMQLVEGMKRDRAALEQVKVVRTKLQALAERSKGTDAGKRAAELDGRVATFEGSSSRFRRGGGGDTFAGLSGDLEALYDVLQGADVTPTTQAAAACADARSRLERLLASWDDLGLELRKVDASLTGGGVSP
jgi:hypothetical protein